MPGVNGDSSLSFCFKLVQHPGILKRAFSHLGVKGIHIPLNIISWNWFSHILVQTSPISPSYLSSFFLKLLNRSLVNPSTLVDKVASCSGLSRVHMANNHNIDVELLLSHGWLLYLKCQCICKALKRHQETVIVKIL